MLYRDNTMNTFAAIDRSLLRVGWKSNGEHNLAATSTPLVYYTVYANYSYDIGDSLYPICPNSSRLFRKLFVQAKTVVESRGIDKATLIWLISAYVLLIAIGMLGNGLTCYAVARNRRMRTPFNLMIVNLAVADLTLCAIAQPFNVVKFTRFQWNFGELTCKLLPALPAITVYVSTGTVCAIAVYRFAMIIYPREGRQTHNTIAIIVIAIIWLLAIVLASPLLLFGKIVRLNFCPSVVLFDACVENTNMKREKIALSITSVVLQYFMPTFLLIATNMKICLQSARRFRFLHPHRHQQKPVPNRQKRDARTTAFHSKTLHSFRNRVARQRMMNILLFVITVVFVISWLPLNVFNMIADVDDAFLVNHFDRAKLLFPICHLIALSSSAINPILYGWFNANFREEFLSIICSHCRRRKNASNHRSLMRKENAFEMEAKGATISLLQAVSEKTTSDSDHLASTLNCNYRHAIDSCNCLDKIETHRLFQVPSPSSSSSTSSLSPASVLPSRKEMLSASCDL